MNKAMLDDNYKKALSIRLMTVWRDLQAITNELESIKDIPFSDGRSISMDEPYNVECLLGMRGEDVIRAPCHLAVTLADTEEDADALWLIQPHDDIKHPDDPAR